MVDDVVLNKIAAIERCVARAREEYAKAPETFAADFTRQDAAILNIQRACEAAIDLGQYIVRRDKLGLPQQARDIFVLMAQAGWINPSLCESLGRMVGYRNIAVHNYQKLLLVITVAIITTHLEDFLTFSKAVMLGGVPKPQHSQQREHRAPRG